MAGEGRPVLAMLGRSDRRLSEALRLHVASGVTPGPGGLLGLELEFSVRTVRGGRVHFGSLIHNLGLDGTALDPGDPNAYRCSWGGVITADGAEAEIATPPVRTRPGFTAQLQAWARTGEAELRRAVPRGTGLDGYSAHFSAAMPAKLNDRVCRLYAQTFAADLMLLMDRIDSPGLLVRPRPGRTELCGEFIENESLAAAAAFVAGTTRACAAAVRRPGARAALPPRLDVRLARAVHRYGWYVDRQAFGTDLHAASRRALLPRESGGTICAQSHLELAWAAARQALADDAAASDLQAAEAMVTGSLPLPAEHSHPDHAPGGQLRGDARFPPGGTNGPDTPRLGAHVRPDFTLRPVAATWDFTVFEATGLARSAYACIPRDSLPGFVAALEEGALDDPIEAYLALTSRRRVLSAPEQTRRAGLYDQMGAPAGLLAPERDPRTGHQESGVPGAKRRLVRPGKRNGQEQEALKKEQEAPRKAARFVPRAAAIGVAIAVVLAGAAVAVISRAQGGPSNPPGLVSFQPTALFFPADPVDSSITRSVTLTDNGSSPVTITGVSIGGPDRQDFSVLDPDLLEAAYHDGRAIDPAAQPLPCHRRVPHAQTCTITVVFTPSAPGSRTADLRIDLASPLRPQDISLTGTGTIVPPSPSPSPSSSPSPSPSVSSPSVSSSLPGATVTFDANGGTGTMAPETGSAPAALTANAFTRTGYSFAGWNTAADGSGTAYADTASYPFSASVTLYAQWTALTYTVTFDANGGTGTTAPETGSAPAALTANAFTRTGYSFAGWNTAADGSGTAYADTASYPFSASVTLYAQWTALTYTVTFDANGGTGTTAPETGSAPAALTANAFTRTGYTFAGWNTAADGSGTAYADTASYPFSASVTLYAQWTALNWPQLSITGPASIGPCAYLGNNPGCPSAQFTASGGDGITSHYTWSATGLPGGVTVSSTGQFGGNPTEYSNQPYPVTVTVTDSYTGQSASMIYQLTVNDDS